MVRKRYQEAVNHISRIPDAAIGPIQKFALAQALAFSGKKEESFAILKNVLADPKYKDLSETQIAKVYIALKENDLAFKWLNRAFDNRDGGLVYLAVEKIYDRIRDDPRYQELLGKMRFPK